MALPPTDEQGVELSRIGRAQGIGWWPYAEVALAMATVGASAVLAKRTVDELPVFFASALRFGLASLLLVPLALRQGAGLPRLAKADALVLVLQSFFGVFGFAIFWLLGLRLTTAVEGGIVASTAPAVIAVASFLLLGERPRPGQWGAAAVAVGGVAAMTFAGSAGATGGAPNPALGNALVLAAVGCEALFFVLGKRVGARVDPLTVAAAVTVVALVLFLPLGLVEARQVDPRRVSVGAWLAVVLYALGPTVLGYVLLYRGLARIAASTAAVFTGIVPVVAVALGAVVLGEAVRPLHLVGLASVLAAIVLTVRVADGGAHRGATINNLERANGGD